MRGGGCAGQSARGTPLTSFNGARSIFAHRCSIDWLTPPAAHTHDPCECQRAPQQRTVWKEPALHWRRSAFLCIAAHRTHNRTQLMGWMLLRLRLPPMDYNTGRVMRRFDLERVCTVTSLVQQSLSVQ